MSLKSAHTAKIGKAFINARSLCSMTQEEVSSLTVINIDYIKAIESGDYAIFPARMFAVQYFKKYAKFLNLEINFFDIYNTEVVAAAEKEPDSDLSKNSFFKNNIISIIFIFFVFLISLIFIFQNNNKTHEATETRSHETSINLEGFIIDIEPSFDNDISELHNEINKFFIQDKLDSIQLDVTVNSSESEA
jgi:cytoskeletal protein RodZ